MANFYTDNPALKHHLTHPLMRKIVALKERDYTDAEKYDYAPMDYEDAIDSYDRVLDIVGDVCGTTIAENAESVDLEGPKVVDGHVEYAPGTVENLDKCRKAGLMGMAMPRRFGGLNFPITPYIMAADIVSRADTGFENLWGLQDCAETIYEFADEDQKQRYITRVCNGETMSMDLTEPDAGSDLQSVMLKATEQPDAGSDLQRVMLKAELCGSRRLGLIKYVMALMNGARLGIAAQSVGVSELAYREALAYARDRRQFGKAIIDFPAVFEMLSVMKAKLDASRSLLYETARYVDLYKAYEDIARERSLTPDERKEMKFYSRRADALTPMAKGMGSEYCNQNAYDCIQIHGGSGFMKDYTCERIYRDARITSIYEGTTQLQVVAAIRHVTTETYTNLIEEYLNTEVDQRLEGTKNTIKEMFKAYTETLAKVEEVKDDQYVSFVARRLVEMAADVVMSSLLLLDANRNEMFDKSLEVYVKMAQADIVKHADFIANFRVEDMEAYKA